MQASSAACADGTPFPPARARSLPLRSLFVRASKTPSPTLKLAYVRVHGLPFVRQIRRTQQREKYKDADALLDAFDPLFKIDHFRVFTVRARLAADRGDAEEAASYARAALELEADKQPQLPRHPDVGHVRTDEAMRSQLRGLARLRSP